MKIIATIIKAEQVSEYDFVTHRDSYIFDSSDSLDHMMKVTGVKDICYLNLSQLKEQKEDV